MDERTTKRTYNRSTIRRICVLLIPRACLILARLGNHCSIHLSYGAKAT